MKSFLLSLSLGMVFFLGMHDASAFSSGTTKNCSVVKGFYLATHTKELILQVPELTEKNLANVRSHVEAGGGMQFAGYCKRLNVMMYVVDTDLHPNYDFLSATFSPLGMSYSVMQGASITQVKNECNIPVSGSPDTQGGFRAE